MRLVLRQRILSWFDSYDVYDDERNVLFVIKGRFSIGHYLEIYDAYGTYLGKVEQEIFHLMPHFNLYSGDTCIGKVQQEFTFFRPSYRINDGDWHVEGDFMGWNYQLVDSYNRVTAEIYKEIFNFTDVYYIEVPEPNNALFVLMIALSIDAANCDNN